MAGCGTHNAPTASAKMVNPFHSRSQIRQTVYLRSHLSVHALPLASRFFVVVPFVISRFLKACGDIPFCV